MESASIPCEEEHVVEVVSSSLDVADAELQELREFVNSISSDKLGSKEQKEDLEHGMAKDGNIRQTLGKEPRPSHLETTGAGSPDPAPGQSLSKVFMDGSVSDGESQAFVAAQHRYNGILDWHLGSDSTSSGAPDSEDFKIARQSGERPSDITEEELFSKLEVKNIEGKEDCLSQNTEAGDIPPLPFKNERTDEPKPSEQRPLSCGHDSATVEISLGPTTHPLGESKSASEPQPSCLFPLGPREPTLTHHLQQNNDLVQEQQQIDQERSPLTTHATNEDNVQPCPPQPRHPHQEQELSEDWVRVVIEEPGSLYIRLQPNPTRNLVFLHSFDPAGYDENGTPRQGPVEKLDLIKPGYLLWSINEQILIGRHFSSVIEAMRRLSATRHRVLLWRKARWEVPENLTPPGGHRPQTNLGSSAYVQRVVLFQTALNRTIIDLEKLRELSIMGIPDASALNGQTLPQNPGHVQIASLRPLIWRMLLGYLSTHPYRWKEDLDQRREFYSQCTQQFSTKPTHKDAEAEPHGSTGQPPTEQRSRSESELFCEIDCSENDPDPPPAPHEDAAEQRQSQVMDHPLAKEVGEVVGGSQWARYWKDADLNQEIRKDVVRTYPELQFFIGEEGSERLRKLERILFVYAKLNPGISYVQGMNEIVGTLLYVFASDPNEDWRNHYEADTFFCFSNLMAELRDVYIENLDETSSGIQGRLDTVSRLLKKQDPHLWHHLQTIQLDPTYYALRWITTLMSREFDLPSTIRLWDSLFASTCRSQFLCRLSVAMILRQRETLLKGDFASNLHLLQSYPPTDLQELLDWSFKLQAEEIKQTGGGLQKKIGNVIKKHEADYLPISEFVHNTVTQVTSNMKIFWPSSTEKRS